MINNFEVFNNSLPDVVGTGIFGLSFLSWQGNKMTFEESKWLVYVFYTIVLLSLLFIFLFKDNIHRNYMKNQKVAIIFYQGIGIGIFSLSIFRIIILAIGGYPNLWELVPFHFCRMFILLISMALCFRRIDLIKYFGIFAIGGGIIGLIIPDLSNSEYWSEHGGMEIGLDNYIFWDFFITHSSSVVLSTYLFASLKPVFYKSEISYTILIMSLFTIMVFLLNLILSNVSDPRWKANWFYLSIPSINGIDDMLAPYLGPLVSYPTILFTFIGIGIVMYLGFTFIYMVSDKVQFVWRNKETHKMTCEINIIPSENFNAFRDGPFKYRKKYNL